MKTLPTPTTPASAIAALSNVEEHHNTFKKSYFWNSPSSASARRSYEAKHSFEVTVKTSIGEVYYSSDVNCSCKNVYYTSNFKLDGEKTTARVLKKAFKSLGVV